MAELSDDELLDALGVEVAPINTASRTPFEERTRTSDSAVSVKFPGAAKAMRLKGAMFEAHTDFATLRAATTQSKRTDLLSVPQYQQALERLDHLLSLRSKELQGHSATRKPHDTTTTRKGNVYGRNKKRFGRGHASSQDAGRVPEIPLPPSSMERNLFQAGSGQRSHEDGRNHSAGHAGPQAPDRPVQATGNAGQEPIGGRRQWRSGGRPTSAASGVGDIDQKIWALAIELNDCEIGSLEAGAIMTQLGLLQGERERQPKGPRPKR